jgi:tetratricopeptide (TPR) repeat protein/DNA-binding CsgD family transcriptional regulator
MPQTKKQRLLRIAQEKTIDQQLQKARTLTSTSADAARAAATQALEHSESLNYGQGIALSLCLLCELDVGAGDCARAEQHAKSAIDVANKYNDRSSKAFALSRLGTVYYHQGQYATAITHYEAAYTIQRNAGDKKEQSYLLTNIGAMHRNLGNFQQSLEYQLRALALKREIGDTLGEAYSLGNAANLYFEFNDFKNALRFYKKSLALLPDKTQSHIKQLTALNIASVYVQLGDLSAARSWHQRLKKNYGSLVDMDLRIRSLYVESMIYKGLKQSSRVVKRLEEALVLAETSGSVDWEFAICQALGQILLQGLQLDAARSSFEKALTIATVSGKKTDELAARHSLVALYKQQGESGLALSQLEKLYELDKSIFNVESDKHIRQLQAKLEIVESERENEKLRAEISRKESDLVALAASLVQKNALIEKLKDDIADLAEQNKGEPCYVDMLHKIDASRHLQKDWNTFERQFTLIHKTFISALSTQCPALSATELKICALLKINLSTKAIAQMLYLSTRTVEDHRLNIRKKLHLDTKHGLAHFLTTLV